MLFLYKVTAVYGGKKATIKLIINYLTLVLLIKPHVF